MGREDGPGRTYEYSTFSTIRRTKDKVELRPRLPEEAVPNVVYVPPHAPTTSVLLPVGSEGVASGSGSHINRK